MRLQKNAASLLLIAKVARHYEINMKKGFYLQKT